MDRVTALSAAESMVGEMLPSDTPAVDALLARSVIPDQAGRWPGQTGWTPSYDPNWLAAEAVQVHFIKSMADGTVTRWTSEGTTMESTPADLAGMVAALRARSIIATQSPATLGVLDVERTDGPHFIPRSGSRPYGDAGGIIGNWS